MDQDQLVTIAGSILAASIVGVFSLWGIRHSLRAQERSEARSRADDAERSMRKYRDPLARAAFDLQSRLYNIVKQDFLGKYVVRGSSSEREYAIESSLHVVAEYFSWVEIMRREIQFLDLGDVERTRELAERLAAISAIFLSERPDPTFRVFRAEQRAIGDVMMTPETSANRQCIGYAEFFERRMEPNLAHWFEQLRVDIGRLAAEPGSHLDRIVELQRSLIDLLDFLDPDHQYFPASQRQKLPEMAGSAAPAADVLSRPMPAPR